MDSKRLQYLSRKKLLNLLSEADKIQDAYLQHAPHMAEHVKEPDQLYLEACLLQQTIKDIIIQRAQAQHERRERQQEALQQVG